MNRTCETTLHDPSHSAAPALTETLVASSPFAVDVENAVILPRLGTADGSRWRSWLNRMRLERVYCAGRALLHRQRPRAAWAGSISLQGRRPANEDRCYIDRQIGLALVVDGMGGYCGGLEAGAFVVSAACEAFQGFRPNRRPSIAEVQAAVNVLVHSARQQMIEHAQQNPSCRQMGATFALCLTIGTRAFVAHMGDCRVYRLTRRAIEALTVDETVVQELINARVLSPSEAQHHPMRHFVTNSLGVRPPERWPLVRVHELQPGDRLLLASDGLTSTLSDRKLHRLVGQADPPQAARCLAAEALREGSRDNVSCIVLQMDAAS